jgi:hypothetical protein
MHLALDRTKRIEKLCEQCSESFSQITGSIFTDGQPLGFYMIALHGHSPEGRLAHLAVAVCSPEGDAASAAILVTAGSETFYFRFLDWSDSPWKSEDIENKLDRNAALQSQFRGTFLRAAEQIVREVPEISEHFSDEPRG